MTKLVDLDQYNKEFAEVAFAKVEEILNMKFTGDEEKDTAILDGIIEFMENPDVSMHDKVKAAKFMASYFGEDPETIDASYVEAMLSETASVKGNIPGKELAVKQWFGAAKLKDNQNIDPKALDEILVDANQKAKAYADKFYDKNEQLAKKILAKIGKLAGAKVRITSKTRKSGYLFVVFSVDTVLNFPNTKQRNGVQITKYGSKEYHLFVGDMNVKR